MKRPKPGPPNNVPADTVSIGGPIGWFDVSISVRSDELDPTAITALFGMDPTDQQTKGVPVLRPDGSVKLVPRFGSWGITIERAETDEWDPEQVAWALLRRLPEDLEKWASLAGAEVRLSFALLLEGISQGFSIEPDLARYLADRGIGLDFHVYEGDDQARA